jgi:hypothetical protein
MESTPSARIWITHPTMTKPNPDTIQDEEAVIIMIDAKDARTTAMRIWRGQSL